MAGKAYASRARLRRVRSCVKPEIAAVAARELRLEGFSDGLGMRRHLLGALLMGFGAMLAGGCAVGAGITGAITRVENVNMIVGQGRSRSAGSAGRAMHIATITDRLERAVGRL